MIEVPHMGEDILDLYKNEFRYCYIILNPFVSFSKSINHLKNLGLIEYLNYLRKNGKKLYWRNVIKLLNIQKYSELFLLLKDSNLGFDLMKRNIISPDEGFLCVLMDKDIIESFRDLNYKYVFCQDEFGDKVEKFNILENNNFDISRGLSAIYPQDKKISYVILPTTFSILLLGSDLKLIDQIVKKYNFEGFYCNEKTRVYWCYDNDV